MSKPILCVDFDGVIHSYTSGWKGATEIPDPPVPGALIWLADALDYWDVCIYSSRSSQEGGIAAMKVWLEMHVVQDANNARAFISQLRFPTEKPAAFLTIDDRAICFDGDWSKLDPEALLNFKPWNKR